MIRALTAATIALSSSAAMSQDLNAIRESVQRAVPEAKVTSVRETPYRGIFEVVINNQQIGYTDATGSAFIDGTLFDVRTRANVTEARLDDLRRVDFKDLPLDKAIVKVRGKGTRKLAVFSDPDCPFCKQLEPELEKLDDVTIYTFLYPLTSIHPDAMRKATVIWCAPDRSKAWDDHMLRDRMPEKGTTSCATPIFEVVEMAKKMGIDGTPGMVFASGKVVTGALPSARIEAYLNESTR